MQEAQVQRQFQHENIVKVVDVVNQNGHVAIVMEYIEGPTLEGWMAENPGPKTVAVVFALMAPILSAVAYVHQRKAVHRDLKPANVLLQPGPNGTWLPKVTDFGLVKVLEDSSGMTRTGTLMGTLPFMAPEQFCGLTDIGTQADVFALGMMYRFLLTGELPANPRNQMAVAQMYSGQDSLSVLPGRVGQVLAAAMRLDPAERLLNATAFERALSGGAVPIARVAATPLNKPKTVFEEPGAESGLERPSSIGIPGGVWIVIAVLFVAFFLMLSGSPNAEKACENARIQESKSVWSQFLSDFPDSRCVVEAEVWLYNFNVAEDERKRVEREAERERAAAAAAANKKCGGIWDTYFLEFAKTDMKPLYFTGLKVSEGQGNVCWTHYWLEQIGSGDCVPGVSFNLRFDSADGKYCGGHIKGEIVGKLTIVEIDEEGRVDTIKWQELNWVRAP
jgi:hypothetical protein